MRCVKLSIILTGLLIFEFVSVNGNVRAQDLDTTVGSEHDRMERASRSEFERILRGSWGPLVEIGGAYLGNYLFFWQYADRVPFHVSKDPPYAMHVDKAAHFYASNKGADDIRKIYQHAGVGPATAVWLGASLSLVAGTVVELFDAIHDHDPTYGFSFGDLGMDFLGCSLPVLQYYDPGLKRITAKISVWPSSALAAYKPPVITQLVQDYESQYYWLSFDIHDWMGDWYPKWLNLAVGMSAENLIPAQNLPGRAGLTPYTDVYIATDLNLRGFDIHGAFWNFICDVFDYIHIPFPAFQFYLEENLRSGNLFS